MRILHFADVHLDRPFVGLAPAMATVRRRALFDGFRHCLDAAKEHDVALVTIGGDLWEEEHVRPDTRSSVAYELGQLGRPVVVITGNHDPLEPGGSYERTDWPGNVTLVRSSVPEEHPFGGVSIWGVSWTSGPLSPAFLDRFQVPADGRTHLLLLHGTCQGVAWFTDDGGSYCPFEPDQVQKAGLAGCLAGHWHRAVWDKKVVYPGSPEPLGWGEDGEHCYALVEVDDLGMTVQLQPVNRTRFDTIELDCQNAGSSAEVAGELEERVRGLDDSGLCLRIRLTGEVAPECEMDPDELAQRCADRFGLIRVEDRTTPAYDLEALSRQETVDGRFVKKLLSKIEDAEGGEREALELGLRLGLRAMHGHPLPHVD